MEKLGGDWYDIFALPDGRIAFSLGDVCGHGIGAAVKMSEAKQAIFVAACLGDPAPESVFRRANEVIFLNGHHVSMTTAVYGLIDTTRRIVTYACAGHHPPILMHSNGSIAILPNHGFPLGVEEHMPPLIKTHEFSYESGSTMVLYTDGLIEFGHDNSEGRSSIDGRAVAEAARCKAEHPAKFIAKRVLGDAHPDDDVALLIVSFQDDEGDLVGGGHPRSLACAARRARSPQRSSTTRVETETRLRRSSMARRSIEATSPSQTWRGTELAAPDEPKRTRSSIRSPTAKSSPNVIATTAATARRPRRPIPYPPEP